MSQSTSSPTSPIAEALSTTEMGTFISRHYKLLIALVVLIIVSIFGYGLYRYQTEQKHQAYTETLYRFQTTELAPFLAQEVSVQEFMQKLAGVYQEVGAFEGLVPIIIQASDELIARGQWEEAITALKKVSSLKREPTIHYFLATREAIAYEDLGQYREAIGVLEGLRSSPLKALEDKLYLDLGRLYFRVGDREKARLSFEHVLSLPMAQNEFAKLASLYLSEL
jgi:predicted negative regulator of RcsB-dependent stress response